MADFTFIAALGAQNWANVFSWGGVGGPFLPTATDNVFINQIATVGTPCIVDSAGQAASTVTIARGNALNVQVGGELAVGGLLAVGSTAGVSQLSVSGTVSAASLLVGGNTDGQGIVSVSFGALTISGNIEAGKFASGTLQVANLGTVNCNFLFVGNSTNSVDGRLVIGGDEFGAAALGGAVNAASGITLETAGSKLIFNTIDNRVFGSKISDIGSVEIKGLATVKLANSGNDYSGVTTVFSGILQAGSSGAFSGNSAFTVNSGAVLDLFGYNNTIKSLSGTGNVTNTDTVFQSDLTLAGGAGNTVFSGVISNTSAAAINLVKNGTERFTLSGDGNSYTGTTTVNGGILRLGDGGTTGSIGTGELIINGGAAFELRKDASFNFTNDISGAGAFQKLFAGTVTTLSGNKDGHTGQTDIFAGTLKGGGANVFGANSAYNINTGANLDLGGFSQAVGALSGEGNIFSSGGFAALTASHVGTTLFSGVMSGSISLIKAGTGTLQLSGVNTHTANTTVNGGTLALTGAGSIANSSIVSVNTGGILDLSGISTASTDMRDLSLNGTGEIRLGGKLLVVTNANSNAGSGGFIVGSAAIDAIQFNVVSTNLTIAGLAFSSWNNFTDKITINGNAQGNSLTGSAQADILNGGIDNLADTLTGGFGDDTYIINTSSDNIVEAVGGGTADRARASVSFVLGVGDNIEFLETANAAGNANLNLTGNEFAQAITGNAGNNVLIGGGNADTMTGLGGNDSYGVDNALDQVIEAVGGGIDRVYASVNYTLAVGQEIETLSTNSNVGNAAINLTGNAFNNALIGNLGANVLNGGGGIDAMTGLGGNDSYAVDNALDTVIEAVGGGIDRVYASVNYTLAVGQEIETLSTNSNAGTAAIRLTGNNFANTLIGNAGANLLLGGLGNDTLTGLNGADTFVFNTALNSATNHDTITDFNVAADTIQLENAIFTALTATGTLAAGLFKDLSLAAQDANDIIVYNRATGDLFYDTNGLTAGGQTLFADVTNGTVLTFADFVVI